LPSRWQLDHKAQALLSLPVPIKEWDDVAWNQYFTLPPHSLWNPRGIRRIRAHSAEWLPFLENVTASNVWHLPHDCGKKTDKIFKNAEKSYNHGHARMSMPNIAKLKIFEKYFFKCFMSENWQASKKSSKMQKIHVNKMMQELCSKTKPNSRYLQKVFSDACEKIERLPKILNMYSKVHLASANWLWGHCGQIINSMWHC